MHEEKLEVSQACVNSILECRQRGGRVIAVGTTSARAIESAASFSEDGGLEAYTGRTSIFIYPGYEWKVIKGMVTNFHLPKSSLLMMISSLVGRKNLLDLYGLAISQKYRFYSFGDAMLLLTE
mmetsp:Transcript_421/g.704  ORF Transcript_421/g.704 Transcript_421/m.704 type:complete len:123 (+) Transcript_421:987-1355(+)